MRKLIGLIATAAAGAIVTVTLLVAPAAQAAVPLPQIGGANPCQAAISGNVVTACLTPNTINLSNPQNCQPFPDGNEFQSRLDFNGVGIDWTFPNGGQACVSVSYTAQQPSAGCSYFFYVPNGFATSKIIPRVENEFGQVFTDTGDTLDENPVSGWQRFGPNFDEPIAAIAFTDSNGIGPTTSQQIGWGNTARFGIWQVCPRT